MMKDFERRLERFEQQAGAAGHTGLTVKKLDPGEEWTAPDGSTYHGDRTGEVLLWGDRVVKVLMAGMSLDQI